MRQGPRPGRPVLYRWRALLYGLLPEKTPGELLRAVRKQNGHDFYFTEDLGHHHKCFQRPSDEAVLSARNGSVWLGTDRAFALAQQGGPDMADRIREDIMRNTLHWVLDNWNWEKTWGWDHPMTAMCATRLGEPDIAVKVLLSDLRTNTYLLSGHNYQDSRLRLYLPGNGGLLSAVALMCAGWDGCKEKNPGFPKDGNWDVRWEGILPMP